MMKSICVTGAAGNLGLLTARHLLETTDCQLRLMIHKKPLPDDIAKNERVKIFACDLAKPETLTECLKGSDIALHYAGILFKANPEKFLPITNTVFFINLLKAAKEVGVPQVALASFPHVEGPTSPDNPSTNRLDKKPVSVHAQTRLEEEKLLYEHYPNGIVLRIGMVYGAGILMPDAARWFSRRFMLGIWRKPNIIHLISKVDFAEAVKNALVKDGVKGTYNIGDDGVQTLQEYLDFACSVWKTKKPWKMPDWMIYAAAWFFELGSKLFGTRSYLTKDFVNIGKIAYYGDTSRMKQELLPELKYPTMREGAEIF
jgi:nucleoside-diphosphate-sugar epimerase